MPHFEELRNAFYATRTLLQQEHVNADAISVVYDDHFYPESFNQIRTAKSRPHYNDHLYPSLFHDLVVLEGGWDHGIESWNVQSITEAINRRNNDPLVRILLAFIWKQGDLHTVQHLVAGLNAQDDNDNTEQSAVMWQFGRHLADPLNQPIFDQHTSRARIIIEQIANPSRELTRDVLIQLAQINEAALRNRMAHQDYLCWWNVLAQRFPNQDLIQDRRNTILLFDRLMFSLGKAAKWVANHPH